MFGEAPLLATTWEAGELIKRDHAIHPCRFAASRPRLSDTLPLAAADFLIAVPYRAARTSRTAATWDCGRRPEQSFLRRDAKRRRHMYTRGKFSVGVIAPASRSQSLRRGRLRLCAQLDKEPPNLEETTPRPAPQLYQAASPAASRYCQGKRIEVGWLDHQRHERHAGSIHGGANAPGASAWWLFLSERSRPSPLALGLEHRQRKTRKKREGFFWRPLAIFFGRLGNV